MIGRASLLSDLRRRLRHLEQDLAERADSDPGTAAALEAEYRTAREAGRTGDTFRSWRNGALTQAAVAWLLGCVFVRFAEDNGLIESPLIAGPGGRNAHAADRQTLYFRARPTDSDNDYLLDVFAEAARLPAMARLYEREHNPVWRHRISGDAARDLIAFWRAVDPDTGALRHDFTDPERDTRFLGDLYQDLSDEAKKRFALLQTPEFVEEFILDPHPGPRPRRVRPGPHPPHRPRLRLRPFPARRLPAAAARMVRPVSPAPPSACSSSAPSTASTASTSTPSRRPSPASACSPPPSARAVSNASRTPPPSRSTSPPATACCTAAASASWTSAAKRSSSPGRRGSDTPFLAEDLDALNRILGRRYHVVVGNPPYVTVKDKAVNRLYRDRYSTCHRQYSLAVPFTERFFGLALPGGDARPAGYVGLITANSFMKREFGKKLIESFLPGVDLTHVIDTSGAYIPGHGTPTVILFGRHRASVGDAVRTVMGIRGEAFHSPRSVEGATSGRRSSSRWTLRTAKVIG